MYTFRCGFAFGDKLKNAMDYTNQNRELFQYLENNDLLATADTPGSLFFASIATLDNATDNLYIKSDTTLQLSKEVLQNMLITSPAPGFNPDPILKFYTPCFKDFFTGFCVSNAEYSCAGRNLM